MVELIGRCNGGERLSTLLPIMNHRSRSASVRKILCRGYEIILGKTSVLAAPMRPAERRAAISNAVRLVRSHFGSRSLGSIATRRAKANGWTTADRSETPIDVFEDLYRNAARPQRRKSASAALRPTRLKVTCDNGDDDGGGVPLSLPSSRLSPISPQPLSR